MDAKKQLVTLILVLLTLTVAFVQVASVQAQDEEDPCIFIMADGSYKAYGSGWYDGYVIAGQSCTTNLLISANGPERLFPVTNILIIVLVSVEAESGGLQSLTINGNPVTLTFTQGKPSYYNKQGGPFQEQDYYGYNDQTVIPDLTFAAAKYPDHWVSIPISITFSSTATSDSKVFFLVYGIDSAGKSATTPFSEGTLFVVPEYLLGGLTALGACFAAFVVIKRNSILHLKI